MANGGMPVQGVLCIKHPYSLYIIEYMIAKFKWLVDGRLQGSNRAFCSIRRQNIHGGMLWDFLLITMQWL